MKDILAYLNGYVKQTDKKVLSLVSFFAAVLIFLNYHFKIYGILSSPSAFLPKFTGFLLLFTFVFSASYLLGFVVQRKAIPSSSIFYLLLIVGPAIYSAKMAFDVPLNAYQPSFSYPWDHYWRITLQWPLKALLTSLLVCMVWLGGKYGRPVAGLHPGNFDPHPYLWLLAAMAPLVVIAGMTNDFQVAYPKLNHIFFIDNFTEHPWLARMAFELSYGLDFFTVEFFFRGFLTLAFVRYVGKEAILPMAVFYCAIHFGKPLAECITSYFGGIILGVIVYHTQSIWGGLMVHLGVAWLMEAAGYFL